MHKHNFYGLNGSGQLVRPEDADSQRLTVYALENAAGNATATIKALCAVSVVALVPKGTLTDNDHGRYVYATSEQEASITGSGRPVGVLLAVDQTTAAIKLG